MAAAAPNEQTAHAQLPARRQSLPRTASTSASRTSSTTVVTDVFVDGNMNRRATQLGQPFLQFQDHTELSVRVDRGIGIEIFPLSRVTADTRMAE